MEGSSGPGDLPPEYLAQASSMSPTFVDPQTAQQQFDWSAYGPGQAVYTTAANAVSPYLTAGPFGSSNPAPQGPGGPYPFGLLPPPLVSPGSVAEASSSWPPHDSSSGPPILEPATPFGLNPNDDSNLSRKGSLAESVQSSSRAGPSTSAAKTTRSCDSCSLRRVRCIRLDPSLGTESECKKCKDKGILCTTNRVVGRRKQQRSGKRIEEARRTFGRIKADGTVQLAERVDRPSDDLGDAVFGDLSQASTDDRLAVASLSSALTMGLLDAYFDIAHLQLPKSFHRRLRYVNPRRGEFNPLESARDRQREDMMEVLQAVVIAFGARASDSPAILGNDAPKIQELKQRGAIGGGIGIVDASTVKVEPDAATGEPEFDPTEWGRRREEVCRTLLERALRLCDEKGAMRIATVESVVALMMLEILIDREPRLCPPLADVTWADPLIRDATDGDPTARRGRPLSLAAIGHVRTLMDDADPDMLSMMGPPSAAPIGSPTSCSSDEDVAGSSEASRSQRQQVDREKEHDMQNLLIGGGGGWAAFVRDGFIAAGTGRALHTTDEDIELFTARYWSQRGVPSRTLEEVVERMDEVDSVEGAKEAEWLIWERVNRLARAHVKRISGRTSRSRSPRDFLMLTACTATPRSRPLLDLDFVCEFWAGLDGVAAALDTAERHLDAAVGANMALSTQEPFLRGNFRLAYLGLCYLVFACDRTLAIRRTDLERDAADHGLDPGRRAYAEQLVAAKQQSEGRCFKAAIRIVGIMHKSLERAPTVGIVTGVHFMYQWLPSCVFYIVGTDEEGQGGPEGYTRSVKLGEIRKCVLTRPLPDSVSADQSFVIQAHRDLSLAGLVVERHRPDHQEP